MTRELLAVAGKPQTDDVFKRLRWRDLIEFATKFNVAIEDLTELPPEKRYEAIAWLIWKATSPEIPFEEFLDSPIPEELFRPADTTVNP